MAMADSPGPGGSIQEPPIEGPLARELEQHKGRWVAIIDERIVAVGDSAPDVRQTALDGGVTDPILFRVPTNPSRLAFF